MERLEDSILLVGRDAGTVIDDSQLNLIRVTLGDHPNGTRWRTGGGGVDQQVGDDTFQQPGISPYVRQIIRNLALDLNWK